MNKNARAVATGGGECWTVGRSGAHSISRHAEDALMAIDPHAIFIQASAFELATLELVQLFKQGSRELEAPFVVNSALSMELYLKCLLHIENKPTQARGHEFVKLFGRLTPQHRTEIANHFEQEKLRHPVLLSIFAAERAGRISALQWGINDVLIRSNEAFEKWRYSYELPINNMVYAGVQPVRDGVRKVILQIHPRWEQS